MSSYLVKRADHYHYRRAIPAAWRGVLGQREWKQSLKCSTRAEALPKARALAVEHDKLIAELEAKGQEQVARDREQEIRQLRSSQRWLDDLQNIHRQDTQPVFDPKGSFSR